MIPSAQSSLTVDCDEGGARSVLRLALGVFLLSLVIRLIWAGFAEVTPISDFHGYDVLAWRWLSTGEFGSPRWLAYRTPGYPAFLAGVYAAFGHSIRAAQLAQAVLGGISSALIVLLAARFMSRRAAALAGLLHAISPTALAYVPALASENVAVPFLLTTLLVLCTWPQRRWQNCTTAAAAGLCFGALVLARPAAVFFAPALLILSLWNLQIRRISPSRAVIFTIACLLPLAPWLQRNFNRGLGFPTISTTGGVNLWMGNNPAATTGDYIPGVQNLPRSLNEREKDVRYRADAIEWMKRDPWRYLSLCRVRLCRLIGTTPDGWAAKYLIPTADNDAATLAYFSKLQGKDPPEELAECGSRLESRHAKLLGRARRFTAPLGILAFILCFARWRRFAPIALPMLCYALGLSLTFFNERFRELWHPLMFILMAGLLSDLIWKTSELSTRPSTGTKRILALAVVVATLLIHAANVDRGLYRLSDPLEVRAAMQGADAAGEALIKSRGTQRRRARRHAACCSGAQSG